MMRENDIISKYFTRKTKHKINRLGIGDDAAILRLQAKQELVVSIDTLVEGVHFFKSTDPYSLGYKALAVSLSDIAAMGAKPISALLSLTLPKADKNWLKHFQKGFFSLADQFKVDLIGGDICQGPLSLSSVVHGIIPQNAAILRSGAKPGDFIFVSGNLGAAAYAVYAQKYNMKKIPLSCLSRLNQPEPRVELGEFLRPFASAMIDISDGLIIDLKRILEASTVGATIFTEQLPIAEDLQKIVSPKQTLSLALSGGDDYELCFTVPEKHARKLAKSPTPITCIGRVEKKSGLRILDAENKTLKLEDEGYEHFK